MLVRDFVVKLLNIIDIVRCMALDLLPCKLVKSSTLVLDHFSLAISVIMIITLS